MFKDLMRKVKYHYQRDDVELLIMLIVASGQIGVKLPFVDNNGTPVKFAVVGYNNTKVFIDVDGIISQLPKDRVTLSKTELKEMLALHKDRMLTHPSSEVSKRISQFRHLCGSNVKVRNLVDNTVYNVPFFRNDSGRVLDPKDPAYHVPMVLIPDFIAKKILYLENIERVLKETA